jgi:hypothetical protein
MNIKRYLTGLVTGIALAVSLVLGLQTPASAFTYSTPAITARLQAVQALIQGQTPGAATGTATAGTIVIGTSGLSGATGVLVTLPLSATCCTLSGNTLTIAGTPLTANPAASGTAALAEIRNSSGTAVASGLTVGLAGSGPGGANPDIVVNTTTVATGVPFTMNSFSTTGR